MIHAILWLVIDPVTLHYHACILQSLTPCDYKKWGIILRQIIY